MVCSAAELPEASFVGDLEAGGLSSPPAGGVPVGLVVVAEGSTAPAVASGAEGIDESDGIVTGGLDDSCC
jgi:hypothetical protein